MQTSIAKEEKESLENDRMKREIAEKEAEVAILQERLKDYDPEALKSQQKALKTRLTNVKKEEASLKKQSKSREKAQKDLGTLRRSVAEKERERNAVEERFNRTQPLDGLKERESELQRQTKKTGRSSKMITPRPAKEKPPRLVWQKETRSSRVCKLKSRNEKGRSLSAKESKKFSKNMASL